VAWRGPSDSNIRPRPEESSFEEREKQNDEEKLEKRNKSVTSQEASVEKPVVGPTGLGSSTLREERINRTGSPFDGQSSKRGCVLAFRLYSK
jgi:hypothetical protein